MNDLQKLRKICKARNVELIERDNGHCQIKGPLLVNYYPNSKKRSAYIAGTKKNTQGVTPEQAVAMSMDPPPIAEEQEKRKGHSRRKRYAMLKSGKHSTCRWCPTVMTLGNSTIEHIIPLARGGLDNANNRTLACNPCNHSRGGNMPELKHYSNGEIMMKPLCIYHGNCADGFAAALAVRLHYGADGVDFHPGVYSEPPPNFLGRQVIMVDFSYKRPTLLAMAAETESILILDHHKSAAAELVDLPPNVTTIFDMNRSGAVIAWEHFHDDRVPPLFLHIQDRDLWRFDLRGTREIQAAVFSRPYEFDLWEELLQMDMVELYREGIAIERKHHKDVHELLGVTRRRMIIGGHDVPVANLPYTLVSDAAHIMAQNEPFAGCYWDTTDGRVFGLRSAEEGLDVSEIAVAYGGGGHEHASGFTMPLGWEGDE